MQWLDKRYYSLNFFLRNTFGEKVIKIPLDAGFTCPNRDGTKGIGGCIFCSEGSGGFAYAVNADDNSVSRAICLAQDNAKFGDAKYIAYFQAYTNTYSPLDRLEKLFTQAFSIDSVCAVSIATRPDCLNNTIVEMLSHLQNRFAKSAFVELGLQTSNETTAALINRCYENAEFENACSLLKNGNINTICHIILGLPNETKADMMETVLYASAMPINGIKLQLMHVLEGTELARMYTNNEFSTLGFEEYIDIVVSCLEIIPPDVVIHRLTGDGDKRFLLAPKWSMDKKRVLNAIDAELRRRNSYQGILSGK